MKAMEEGRDLSKNEHDMLKDAMRIAAKHEPELMAQVAFQQEVYSGPLPHHEQLNGYDEETRRIIVDMAVQEQAHSHEMYRTGLTGAIAKDQRAQYCALTVALGALATAGWMAQFSPVAAAVIGGLDLVGLVGVFLFPRMLEARNEKKQQAAKPPATPERKRSGGRAKR
ncbi:DUF2335 domain-containing protein [Pseudomonas mosselii]|uniref:DUF2335 domain-containing protein n=1 Tax=Pseudomonas mosselii TaxID=78327 RepID=A0A7W2PYP6_9PSED|nr:DUF2335 domain-containing protein [Pseudomonas mosselii]MBA6065675.1 DUF2335 domain-containing protein [Pseudomonas mosselii]